MRKDERGSILIEFVGSFLLFFLLMMSVLSLINIVTVQARMHFALTQAANMLSVYGYVLHAIGADDVLMNIDDSVSAVHAGVNDTVDDINAVFSSINKLDLPGVGRNAEALGSRVGDYAESVADDPLAAIQLMMRDGTGQAFGAVFEQALRPLVKHFLRNGEMSGEEFLRSMRINEELQFYTFNLPGYTPPGEGALVGSLTKSADNNSTLLDGSGNIRITVRYEIEYSFMGLPIPWPGVPPTLSMTQSVITRMWLGGSGDAFSG